MTSKNIVKTSLISNLASYFNFIKVYVSIWLLKLQVQKYWLFFTILVTINIITRVLIVSCTDVSQEESDAWGTSIYQEPIPDETLISYASYAGMSNVYSFDIEIDQSKKTWTIIPESVKRERMSIRDFLKHAKEFENKTYKEWRVNDQKQIEANQVPIEKVSENLPSSPPISPYTELKNLMDALLNTLPTQIENYYSVIVETQGRTDALVKASLNFVRDNYPISFWCSNDGDIRENPSDAPRALSLALAYIVADENETQDYRIVAAHLSTSIICYDIIRSYEAEGKPMSDEGKVQLFKTMLDKYIEHEKITTKE